jgi:hypothetical protein
MIKFRKSLSNTNAIEKDEYQKINDQGGEDSRIERDIPHRHFKEDGLSSPGNRTQD